MREPDHGNECDCWPSLWWFQFAFIWLAVAAVLGGLRSALLFGVDFGSDISPFLPFGRLSLATDGAFLYGWGLNGMIAISIYLFPGLRGKDCLWHKVCCGIGQVGIALGVLSVLSGEGSGIKEMPFASWALPFILFALLGVIVLIAGRAYVREDRLSRGALASSVSALSVVSIFLILFYLNGGAGIAGIMLSACYALALPMCALVVSVSAHLKRSEGGHQIIKKLGFILLCMAVWVLVPFAGLSMVAAWPVPWEGIYWGFASSFGLLFVLIAVCMVSLYSSIKGRHKIHGEREYPAFINKNVGLACMTIWLVWKVVDPLTSLSIPMNQFTLIRWYAVGIFMFLSVGLVGVPVFAVRLKTFVNWKAYLWLGACLFPVFVAIIIVYSCNIRNSSGDREMSALAVLVSGAEMLAWLLLLIVALLLIPNWRRNNLEDKRRSGIRGKWRVALPLLFLVAIACGTGTIFNYYQRMEAGVRKVMPFESSRPGRSLEGSRIYASEGCALCHTQLVRRLFSGVDIQREIDFGYYRDVQYRVTEPQDFDLEMKEGAPHAGYTRIGPGLFNLAARVPDYVSYKDHHGKKHLMATPEEWLLLHLYNPRDPSFGKPWSLCPPMRHLFQNKKISPFGKDPRSLPIDCEEGYEVVPTERAKALVDYLMTLKRSEKNPGGEDESPYVDRPFSHINPQYIERKSAVDFSALEKEQRASVFEKGERLYKAKCSVCHGVAGDGDAMNYPPLNDSEWLKDRKIEIIAGIVKNGIKGPIMVKGREWNSTMMPPGVANGEELGALLNYIIRTFTENRDFFISDECAERLWSKAGDEPLDYSR